MATKCDVVKALITFCPNAVLIDDSSGNGYSVKLEAPEGHHWENDVHCRVVDCWYSGGK